MLKILAIAPYQNLKTKIDEIAENFKTLYVESYVGDLSVGLAIAQKKHLNLMLLSLAVVQQNYLRNI
ncbi:hypothetical protein O2F50_10105 [Lacticaseibacillus paracasei]|nr:hypothetical protein [Lacticaseibacillus paracasei]EKQ06814.1 hypothetical protein LCAM36_1822 [Lacticaseibacillus paracasei]MCZ2766103.1 hypothetical protein [Lacticaseibacillus paracasei]MCZ2769005.1 hypothetical protein [Lacticaseibacillus paracasei]MCZ2774514.1 hypothetical protein [Lacticaseibacillus paracasei]MCZ2777415.1 hypothetical protein [Lacticaseibacillus paracasei]